MHHDFNHLSRTDKKIRQKLLNRLLATFFGYLYHELAWIYDWVAAVVSKGRWNTWVETSLEYLNGQKILELGHGPGHLIIKIIRSGRDIYGIDLSPQMSAMAYAKLRRLSFPANLSTAQSQKLPFAAEVFDQVVATFPTEYILEKGTLTEIYRVLKPDGSAVIVPAAYITGTNLIDKALVWLFKVSGQAPEFNDRALEPAIRIGFEITSTNIALDDSEVKIILASKKITNSSKHM